MGTCWCHLVLFRSQLDSPWWRGGFTLGGGFRSRFWGPIIKSGPWCSSGCCFIGCNSPKIGEAGAIPKPPVSPGQRAALRSPSNPESSAILGYFNPFILRFYLDFCLPSPKYFDAILLRFLKKLGFAVTGSQSCPIPGPKSLRDRSSDRSDLSSREPQTSPHPRRGFVAAPGYYGAATPAILAPLSSRRSST